MSDPSKRSIKASCAHSKNEFDVLGLNDTSTHEGHFVSSPREREDRDRRIRKRDRGERGTGMKKKKQKK